MWKVLCRLLKRLSQRVQMTTGDHRAICHKVKDKQLKAVKFGTCVEIARKQVVSKR